MREKVARWNAITRIDERASEKQLLSSSFCGGLIRKPSLPRHPVALCSARNQCYDQRARNCMFLKRAQKAEGIEKQVEHQLGVVIVLHSKQ